MGCSSGCVAVIVCCSFPLLLSLCVAFAPALQVLNDARHVTKLLCDVDEVLHKSLWRRLDAAGSDASTRRLVQKLGQQELPPKVSHLECSGVWIWLGCWGLAGAGRRLAPGRNSCPCRCRWCPQLDLSAVASGSKHTACTVCVVFACGRCCRSAAAGLCWHGGVCGPDARTGQRSAAGAGASTSAGLDPRAASRQAAAEVRAASGRLRCRLLGQVHRLATQSCRQAQGAALPACRIV
jgi:hypothetical protein